MHDKSYQSWLESELAAYPEKSAPNDFYIFATARCNEILKHDRTILIAILRDWLSREDKIKSVLAVELSVDLKLNELHDDIIKLLGKIKSGKIWQPYYVAHIERILLKNTKNLES